MGVLPIVLMYFFISEIRADNTKSERWLDEFFFDEIIRVDAEGNIYLGDGDKLHKINASDKINTAQGEFIRTDRRYFREDMLENSRGDDFMMDRDTLRVVKAGSRKSEEVAKRVVEFHVDNNDNLFYVREEKYIPPNYRLKINLIRPYSAAPVQILNSSDFRRLSHSSVVIKSDKSGNVYMAMHFLKSNAIVELTNETLKEQQPVSKYVNITETEYGECREIYDFMIVEENNSWILCRDGDSVVVSKLINDTWTEILREEVAIGFGFCKSRLLNIKGKLFIVIQSIMNNRPNIYYIASNDKAIKLKGSDSLSGSSTSVKWTVDDEGQIYFYNSEKMLTLKPNETQLIPVQIDRSVRFAVVDWKNNVWIAAGSLTGLQLYYLKKGETIPELIYGDV